MAAAFHRPHLAAGPDPPALQVAEVGDQPARVRPRADLLGAVPARPAVALRRAGLEGGRVALLGEAGACLLGQPAPGARPLPLAAVAAHPLGDGRVGVVFVQLVAGFDVALAQPVLLVGWHPPERRASAASAAGKMRGRVMADDLPDDGPGHDTPPLLPGDPAGMLPAAAPRRKRFSAAGRGWCRPTGFPASTAREPPQPPDP